jgi:hypothetical protein
MANSSLPQLDTFQPISATAVHVLARLAAKRAVQEQLRAAGVRVTLVPPRVIAEKAQVYLADHPELIDAAKKRAKQLGMFEKPRRKLKQPMVTLDK